MTRKILKRSSRGLTFSFDPAGKFKVGTTYKYIIDQKSHKLLIIPAEDGKLVVSKKHVGEKTKPLLDIRNREVHSLFSGADYLQVTIRKKCITVEAYLKDENVAASNMDSSLTDITDILKVRQIAIAKIPIVNLDKLAKASGEYHQITFDEWCSGITYATAGQFSKEDILSHQADQKILDTQLPIVYRVASLFSGAGCLDLPFKQDPMFNIVYACDNDPDACLTYRTNIGTHIINKDIHKVHGTDFVADVIIGGPSCKPFAGCNRGTRLADHKDSDLILNFIRVIKESENTKVFLNIIIKSRRL